MSHSSSQTASSSHVSNRFEERMTPGGVYDQLIDKISELGNLTLAGADYGGDLNRRITERGNYKYVFKEDLDKHENAPDCHFIIFGQTCLMSLGTQLSSRGNNINYKVRTHHNRVQDNPSLSIRTKRSAMTPL
jgi:hypothetical protein